MSSKMIDVDLGKLEMALDWVSYAYGLDNGAFISKIDGSIHYTGEEEGLLDEEAPDDIDDPDRYWSVPDTRALGLGSSLVFRYIEEMLPDDYETVRGFFRRKGAYGRFKDLLDRRGHLDRWYEFSNRATEEALREWAEECGFRVVKAAPGARAHEGGRAVEGRPGQPGQPSEQGEPGGGESGGGEP
ncbi:MAG: hypothetical protein AB7L76_02610 [Burkholderiaceae bacterium]